MPPTATGKNCSGESSLFSQEHICLAPLAFTHHTLKESTETADFSSAAATQNSFVLKSEVLVSSTSKAYHR